MELQVNRQVALSVLPSSDAVKRGKAHIALYSSLKERPRSITDAARLEETITLEFDRKDLKAGMWKMYDIDLVFTFGTVQIEASMACSRPVASARLPCTCMPAALCDC